MERKKKNRVQKFLLCLLTGICVVGMTVECKAAEPDTAEVEAFVTAFYEAHTEENIDSLKDYVAKEEYLEEYLRQLEICFTYGVTKYDNIDVLVYPLQSGDYWLVTVCSDMIVGENQFALPGMRAWLVYKGEDDRFVIFMDDQEFSDLSDEMIEEMRQASLSDEIIDRNNETAVRYMEILDEHPEVQEWVFDVQNALWMLESENYTYELTEEEKENANDDTYIVQKGDCLWYIAEEQLGDGMRWSEIYKDNRSVIGDDPDLLYEGIQLQINQ